jgi:hypothetical protein
MKQEKETWYEKRQRLERELEAYSWTLGAITALFTILCAVQLIYINYWSYSVYSTSVFVLYALLVIISGLLVWLANRSQLNDNFVDKLLVRFRVIDKS